MAKKKFPISRMNKFYDETDFSLENEMAREYIEGDLNIVVVLFQVDKIESEKTGDDVYGEVDGDKIKFKAPKELNVRITLEPSVPNTSYAGGHVQYSDYGNLSFTVFMDHLKELDVDISYGDYIGYPDREDNIKYFTVSDDGRVNSDNTHTRLGYKSYYRSITCVTADLDEFNPPI
jgi:hypothetical protein